MKNRNEIPDGYKWNIELMYADDAVWEEDLSKASMYAERYARHSGKLGSSAKALLAALRDMDRVWLTAERVYVYARMRRDEDNNNSKYQAMADKAQVLFAKVAAELSFFTPEFLAIPKTRLADFRRSESGLAGYAHIIDVLLRKKPHVLSKKEENLLAVLSEPLSATNEIFSMINNADIKFGNIKDESGKSVELTHGNYINFLESKERKVRKAAYDAVYSAYGKQRNTLAATYSYNTKTDALTARVRNYGSSLEAALSGDNVPLSVYDNLIDIVNESLPVLHRYMGIRRKLLGVRKLKMYDVYVPLFHLQNDRLEYEDAVDLMCEALQPLGESYIEAMASGVRSGWIDVFENEGKSSGAYSFGSYDSMPYILMNYSGRLKDAFTLVHEMGHSMHSYFTRKTQPYRYGSHSIFTAEVASTVNESLLMNYLLDTRTGKAERRYLTNMYIEEFRTTLFRQTMFAEFEKQTHEAVERGDVLTADYLCGIYSELNAKYFGSGVDTDSNIAMEWARIPHFYRAFYVYKYATGYSAATAISGRILDEGYGAVRDYLHFLKLGDSDDPIELLKIAGVDMASPEPIEDAMGVFEGLVDDLEELI
ncbi:MAG: oligoendopeptidase F [Clostridiales Family XIII bacterium]|jgi:oligoendopeptidase F|nr:oligoendopeptidase F [Clostridiales Family XIII bacterium]